MAVEAVYRGLDITTIILLLTGQITISGVFVAPNSFALSLSGPITGGGPEGKTEAAALVLDGLDIITAILIILDQINVIGTYITSGRFTIVVGGPPFGIARVEAYTPTAQSLFSDYEQMLFNRYPIVKSALGRA